MQRILVTGGTGFIGARLLHVAGHDYTLHSLSRREPSARVDRHFPLDLRDHAAVVDAVRLSQPDAIIHLAAAGVTSGARDLNTMLAVNVLGVQSLFEGALACDNPPHMVMAGSWFEYAPLHLDEAFRPFRESDALSAVLPYSASKQAATVIASHYVNRVPVTVLRVFSVYGVGEPLPRLAPYIVAQTLASEPIDLTGGEQVRDYIYADDAARGFLLAAAHPPTDGAVRVLNLGTGVGIRLRDFMETLRDILRQQGYNPQYHIGAKPYRPDEVHYAVAERLKWEETLPPLEPFTPLEQGLRAFVQDAVKNG
jgi:nucleoside-diphosphate-sugar epimerase